MQRSIEADIPCDLALEILEATEFHGLPHLSWRNRTVGGVVSVPAKEGQKEEDSR